MMIRAVGSVEGVGVVVRRLRARQREIEDAICRLREISRAQAVLLDQLASGVTRERGTELQPAGRSRQQCVLERVRMLLAGGRQDVDGAAPGGVDLELGYDLGGEHVGVIAVGAECEVAVRDLEGRLQRRLLCVASGEGVVWAWLGGRRVLPVDEVEQACAAQAGDVRFALGEPAGGLEGWRMTHRQAQGALLVARCRPQRVTRYGDVALLAAALDDEVLGRSLLGIYLAPLGTVRDGGEVLLQSLRAYLAAECSVSSAAAALGVSRKTVEGRLRTVEEKLGRTLHPCPAELEVALLLDELGLA